METRKNNKKVFNFGEASLVKQTEKAVIEGVQAIENKETHGTENDMPMGAEATHDVEPTQNINIPIPVSLHQRLKIISATRRRNMKDLVAIAIKEYVDKQG